MIMVLVLVLRDVNVCMLGREVDSKSGMIGKNACIGLPTLVSRYRDGRRKDGIARQPA